MPVFTPIFEPTSAGFSPSPTSGAWRSGEQHGDYESRTRATGAGIRRSAGGTSQYKSKEYRKFFGVATRQAPDGVPVPQAELARSVRPVARPAPAKAGVGRGSEWRRQGERESRRDGVPDPMSRRTRVEHPGRVRRSRCQPGLRSERTLEPIRVRSRGPVKHGGQDCESQRLPSGSRASPQTGERCARRAMQGPSSSVQSSSAAGLNALTSWCWILTGTGS